MLKLHSTSLRNGLKEVLNSVNEELVIASPYIKTSEAKWVCDELERRRPAAPVRLQVLTDVRSAKVRDARFRQNVLTAYGNRCAVSGMQLDLVDAAHIIPVDHERGTDELKNGLCLSALHHRAFDNGLIGIKRDHSVILNERRMSELHSIGWDGGAAEFKASLPDEILLPARRGHHPDPDYLVFGQQLRGWQARQLAT